MHSQAGGSFLARFLLGLQIFLRQAYFSHFGLSGQISRYTISGLFGGCHAHTHTHVHFLLLPCSLFDIGSINTHLSRDAIENSMLLSFVGRCSWSDNWADHRLCLEPGHEQYRFLLLWLQADLQWFK